MNTKSFEGQVIVSDELLKGGTVGVNLENDFVINRQDHIGGIVEDGCADMKEATNIFESTWKAAMKEAGHNKYLQDLLVTLDETCNLQVGLMIDRWYRQGIIDSINLKEEIFR